MPRAQEAAQWWWQACTDQATWSLLALAAASLLFLALGVRAWLRLGGGWARRQDPQAGTATIEFALAFPIILFLALLLIQTTLLMAGQFFIHYAAFAATRAALVQVPSDQPGEPANVIVPLAGSPKQEAIHRAAAVALAPVSGSLAEQVDLDADAFAQALDQHYTAMGLAVPRWVDTLAAARLRYAWAYTDTALLEPQVTGAGVAFVPLTPGVPRTYGPRDPLTVHVTHRFNLSIPYVRAIFADGRHDAGDGAYAMLEANCTLTNEGIDPALPPEPRLPRRSGDAEPHLPWGYLERP